MIRVGILGEIGSGKSYIAKTFGYPVFNADYEVSILYKKDKKIFRKLNRILPKYFYKFPINKLKISEAILADKKNLAKIIKIVHLEIKKKMLAFLKKNRNKKIVVLDIPLYFENKMNKKNDIIIFLKTIKKEADKRIKKRKNFSKKLLNILRESQLPLKQKRKKSKYILVNNYDAAIMKKKVKILKDKILNDRSSS